MASPDSDLDDQLRAAMKVLDDEVPSGYWEALPNQTLARLEGSSMQQGTSGSTESANKVGAAPPMTSETTEDSGLHDIRNLAQSTKQRLSSKRITASNPTVEDDIASSSAGWKAVALPQPAKMVALPELNELPSKKDIKAAEKAAAKERKAAEAVADHATAQAALAPVSAPVEATASARSAFQLPSAQRSKKSKGPLIALVGLGVAAAAAAAVYVTTQAKTEKAPAVARAETTTAVTATPIQQNAAVAGAGAGSAAPASAEVQKADEELAKQQAANDAMKAQLAAAQAAAPADEGKDKPAAPVKAAGHATKTVKGKGGAKLETGASKVDETKQTAPDKTDKTKTDTKTQKNADGSEPDFNDLLKEAGVNEKKEQKPKLEKKSLTGDDFKNGMSAIDGKAHGCYKGTQGTAMVKLTIAPTGQNSKIAVTGMFAGKPEASCVAAAVRGATFPAWDGGPESFTYPILLSE